MLQIRVSLPAFDSGVNFTDPIVLENAENISLIKTISSSDESISFDFPLNDPKLSSINYLRWWECWDTATNERLNYGPIHNISRASGETKKITGPGRSAVLSDFYKSIQTFYYPIDEFFDDLRYENIAGEPRTQTFIEQNTSSIYYGLSKRTKDRAIDEQTGYIAIGRDVPARGIKRTDSYWAGTGKADWLIVDLGDTFTISRTRLLLPWWGGATIDNDRRYNYRILASNGSDYASPNNNSFTTEYDTGTLNPYTHLTQPEFGGTKYYYGETPLGVSTVLAQPDPVISRYWKIDIYNTFAFYGSAFTGILFDGWDWQCAGSNVLNGVTKPSPSVSTGTLIGTTELTISNDCFASVVEFTADRKILGLDTVSKLTYHQIDNNNRQITYYHVTDGEFDIAMFLGATKFEPGNFFRKFTFNSLLGGDCTFTDDYNIPIFSGPSGSTVNTPAYTKFVNSTNPFEVTYVDCWNGRLDPLSYSGTYSWTPNMNDTATLHLRGVSFKWYSTVPDDVVPGTVQISIREKLDGTDTWSAWTVLDTVQLTAGISAEKVYEITYESGILTLGKTYEIELKNMDGLFVSIDSFAGYWEGTQNFVNEDDDRVRIRLPNQELQLYDQRFSSGSIYEYRSNVGSMVKQGLSFFGDRIIIYGRKGPNYGTMRIGLWESNFATNIPIPGGEGDGGLLVDLNYPYDVAQAVIFDSNDYFKEPSPLLKWQLNSIIIYATALDDGPLWVDGFEAHETSGVSVKFLNQSHLDILKDTTEALQMEWDITELGLKVVPRLGTDTNVVFAEGRGTTIKIQDVQDIQQVATQLVSSGADIDGLPLTTVVEDKNTRKVIGRTIQRLYDARSVGDYFTLIGAARTELLRRRVPQKRISLTTTNLQGVTYGDSFMIKHPELESRVRAITINRTQSSGSGTVYEVECQVWPAIT